MADIRVGINPTQVDTVAQWPAGTECEDPRGGVFTGNTIKYCQLTGTVTAADAVKIDVTATAANRRFSVNRTSATAQPLEGIANASGVNTNFIWITTKGTFFNANVLTATAAGSILATSAVAGQLVVSPAALADINAIAGGRRGLSLVVAASNLADILVGG